MVGIWIVAGAAALALALAAAGGLLAWAMLARERRLISLGRELDELLAASRSAPDRRRLLVDHAQQVATGAAAALLTPAPSGDRLVPHLGGADADGRLRALRPGPACVALRLGDGYGRRPGEPKVALCEVCGPVEGHIACEPLIWSGTRVGALLVTSPRRISDRARAALRDSARRTAPLLGAGAGHGHVLPADAALAGPLTALPDRRAAERVIGRMVAHAGRTLTPLALILVELDHFAALAELHGGEPAADALAAAGRLIGGTVRASDFGARCGDADFLLLLPDTGRAGAVELAEKIRQRIERTALVARHPVTASLGVATLPDDAVDAGGLLARAEQALTAARELGRNRVHAAEPAGPPLLG